MLHAPRFLLTSGKARLSWTIAHVACALVVPFALSAQALGVPWRPTEATSARLREQCANASDVAKRRGSDAGDTAKVNAVRQLAQCDNSAGAVLPELWGSVTTPESSSDELQALLDASVGMRDRRIATVLEGLASDATKDLALREAALVMLASYINPRLTGTVARSTRSGVKWIVSVARVDHARQTEGSEPTDDAQRVRTLRLLESIGQGRGAIADRAHNLHSATKSY